jgi:hypothetical protein
MGTYEGVISTSSVKHLGKLLFDVAPRKELEHILSQREP